MLITVGSLKGSPGATTFAGLLASAWPTDPASDPDTDPLQSVLLEADPEGGVLGSRWVESLGVSWTPGLVEVTSQCRGGGSMIQALTAMAQPVTSTLGVIPGLPNRGAMTSALTGLSDASVSELARWGGLVVADVGRFSKATANLVRRSQLTLVVAHPTLESAQLLQAVVPDLVTSGGRVGLVTVGDDPYGPGELAEAVHIDPDLVWAIPSDARVARAVTAGGPECRGVRRSRLGRSMRALAGDIALLTNTAPQSDHVLPADRKVRDVMAETGVASNSFGEVVNRG